MRERIVRITTGALCAALCGGCISQPKLRPDRVGLSDLPLQYSAGRSDMPPYSDATGLPLRAPDPAAARAAYRVGPLDDLVVLVWGRDDLGSQVPIGLSGELRGSGVREDGMLVMPFLGPFPVVGRTVEEIRAEIQSRYAKLIENPQVEIRLHSCASQAVEIGGEVTRPGRYHLCATLATLGDLLSAAQGPSAETDLARGVLTRDGTPYHLHCEDATRGTSRASDILLQQGDRIYFPRLDERVVYIFGEVGRQGIYPIPREGMTLVGALARARGVETTAAAHKGIYLVRQFSSGALAYKLKMADVLQGPDIPLANGDRLFVPLRPIERWDRWWRKALPFTTVRTNVEVLPE